MVRSIRRLARVPRHAAAGNELKARRESRRLSNRKEVLGGARRGAAMPSAPSAFCSLTFGAEVFNVSAIHARDNSADITATELHAARVYVTRTFAERRGISCDDYRSSRIDRNTKITVNNSIPSAGRANGTSARAVSPRRTY